MTTTSADKKEEKMRSAEVITRMIDMNTTERADLMREVIANGNMLVAGNVHKTFENDNVLIYVYEQYGAIVVDDWATALYHTKKGEGAERAYGLLVARMFEKASGTKPATRWVTKDDVAILFKQSRMKARAFLLDLRCLECREGAYNYYISLYADEKMIIDMYLDGDVDLDKILPDLVRYRDINLLRKLHSSIDLSEMIGKMNADILLSMKSTADAELIIEFLVVNGLKVCNRHDYYYHSLFLENYHLFYTFLVCDVPRPYIDGRSMVTTHPKLCDSIVNALESVYRSDAIIKKRVNMDHFPVGDDAVSIIVNFIVNDGVTTDEMAKKLLVHYAMKRDDRGLDAVVKKAGTYEIFCRVLDELWGDERVEELTMVMNAYRKNGCMKK